MRRASSMADGGDPMFTGKTKNLGVMGWPVEHSLSPGMQNAAIAVAGLDYAYVALPVPPEGLADAVRGLRFLGFRGWNVTIPHKSAILGLLDETSEDARVIGAVNTVVHDKGRLLGYNTDVAGFLDGLAESGRKAAGCHAVLLGTGGAARAVLWALCREGAASVTLGARSLEKARRLAAEFSAHGTAEAFQWEDPAFRERLAGAGLLVNATPIGMYPDVEAMPPVDLGLLPSGALVYDIIYTPERTRLLQQAEARGLAVQNGEAMLAGQGAAALELWTGTRPAIGVMRKTLRGMLARAREDD